MSTMVLDKVNGGWTGVSAVQGTCQNAATEFWESVTNAPLAFVAGSFRYDNATTFYSPQHPSVFVGFDYFGNRWATPQAIAARGLLTICLKDDKACLNATTRFSTPATQRRAVRRCSRAAT